MLSPHHGYLDPNYSHSLSEFGAPRELARCGGWVLERAIQGTNATDVMGPYPLFACHEWSRLNEDLQDLEATLPTPISLVLVSDPFGNVAEDELRRCFPDVMRPFKEHFVVDLCMSVNNIVSKHHRYYARRALKSIRVETVAEPTLFMDEWQALYATLVKRHDLRGIKAFSSAAFARQLSVSGLMALRAVEIATGMTVGAHLWYAQGDVVYSHLAAFSDRGYELMASYALYWTALERFAESGMKWLDIGASAGAQGSAGGLNDFKRGWATSSRTVFVCGRVFDHERYTALCVSRGLPTASDYFPAYRSGEF